MNRLNDDSQLKDTIIYSKGKNFSYFYRVSWCILLNNVYEVNICCFLLIRTLYNISYTHVNGHGQVLDMKVIPIQKSVFTLLILEAVILALITIILIFSLYRSYTHLIYTESSEVLCLYTIIAQSRLSRIEDLSYEILSNHSIQENMKTYTLSDSSYEKNLAKNVIYAAVYTMGDG